jgi:hypothetical protein
MTYRLNGTVNQLNVGEIAVVELVSAPPSLHSLLCTKAKAAYPPPFRQPPSFLILILTAGIATPKPYFPRSVTFPPLGLYRRDVELPPPVVSLSDFSL